MKNLLAVFLFGILFSAFAQRSEFNWKPVDGKEVKRNRDKYHFSSSLEKADKPFRTFSVDASKGGHIRIESGTEISIPANAFVTGSGSPFGGEATIKYREFYTVPEVLASGIPMNFGKPSSFQNLQSAGMFEIGAWAGNQELFLKTNKSITVKLASYDVASDYKQYYLDASEKNKDVWKEMGPSVAIPNQAKQNELKELQKQDVSGIYFSLKFDTVQVPELASFYNTRWQYAGKEQDSLNPTKNVWIQNELWTELSLFNRATLEDGERAFTLRNGAGYSTDILTSGDNSVVMLYNPNAEKSPRMPVVCLKGKEGWVSEEKSRFSVIDISTSGKWIAAADYENVYIWNIYRSTKATLLKKDWISSSRFLLEIKEETEELILVDDKGNLRVYNCHSGELIRKKKISAKKDYVIRAACNTNWFALTNYSWKSETYGPAEFYDLEGNKLGLDSTVGYHDFVLSNTPGIYARLDDSSSICEIVALGKGVKTKISIGNNSAPVTTKVYTGTYITLHANGNAFTISGYDRLYTLYNWNGTRMANSEFSILKVSEDLSYAVLEDYITARKIVTGEEISTSTEKKYASLLQRYERGVKILNLSNQNTTYLHADIWQNLYFGENNKLYIINSNDIWKFDCKTLEGKTKTLLVQSPLRSYHTLVNVSPEFYDAAKRKLAIVEQRASEMRAKELQRMADFQREFQVNNMGIYNVDKIANMEDLITKEIRFTLGDKPLKKQLLFYQISGAKGEVVVKNSGNDFITYSRKLPNALLVIAGDKMATVTAAQFKFISEEQQRNEKILQIELVMNPLPKDAAEYETMFKNLK